MKRFLALALLKAIALLPWSAIQWLGGLLGGVLLWKSNRQRRDALINIRMCFPELSGQQQLELRRRAMIHFAKTYVELAALWLWPAERVLGLVRRESGTELLQCKPGERLIVLSPHLGAWELAGLYMATKGSAISMYRPQRHLDDVILAARQRNGAVLVPDDVSGVKRLLRVLKRGGLAGILPDQVAREESGSVFAPFFGVPAVTMLLVAGLARRTGARVVFLFAERLPDGEGFHMHCLSAPEGIADPDDQVAAAALNRGVEACIHICPEQYQWPYRRFRRRPDDGPSPYTGPSV
jgi:KDO2-lipid IV(A) lauroyltransferase